MKEKKVMSHLEKQVYMGEAQNQIMKAGEHLMKLNHRNKDTNHINRKIYHLLCQPFTFVNAYGKISKNKGALAKGHLEEGTMELFGLKTATTIANSFKNGTYKFSPVRRTWIPKPGKSKKRPIDTPTQKDRIIQEAVRGILEAIFEPEFKKFEIENKLQSTNYGFRPKRSTWTAIETLKKKSGRCNLVIEGDIVSAYNNVDHKILIQIIRRRVKDNRFIEMLEKMLKSGIMDKSTFTHSLTGTPQGGIVSPLLFNIYLFGFDQFIYNEIIQPINFENEKKIEQNPILQRSKKVEITSPEYVKKRWRKTKALKDLKKARLTNAPSTEIKEKKKLLKQATTELLNTPYANIQLLPKGAVYVRYADDWVLALTTTKAQAQQTKRKIAEFLWTFRKMKLDEEKTKIAAVVDGYKFLAFEIRMHVKQPKIMRVVVETKKEGEANRYSRPLRRTTSRLVTVEPDSERILKNLKLNGFCDEKYFPIGKGGWIIYDEFQIVQKFAQVMRGIFNYYRHVDNLTRLYHVSYILQYSCAKTLARRRKVSLREIFNLYTKNLKITIPTQKKPKTIEFLDLASLRKLQTEKEDKQREKGIPTFGFDPQEWEDPFRIHEHWRTKHKVYTECCICGAEDDIALHHINSISALKKQTKDPNQVIRSQIKRKQIPVCTKCHLDITAGRYNNPKKPAEFYNEFIAKL